MIRFIAIAAAALLAAAGVGVGVVSAAEAGEPTSPNPAPTVYEVVNPVTGEVYLVPAADLPNVGADECALIDVTTEAEKPTYVNPDPAVTAMALIQYCGFSVPGVNSSGGMTTRTERRLVYVPIGVEHAEIIVNGAVDLLDDDGSVFLP